MVLQVLLDKGLDEPVAVIISLLGPQGHLDLTCASIPKVSREKLTILVKIILSALGSKCIECHEIGVMSGVYRGVVDWRLQEDSSSSIRLSSQQSSSSGPTYLVNEDIQLGAIVRTDKLGGIVGLPSLLIFLGKVS